MRVAIALVSGQIFCLSKRRAQSVNCVWRSGSLFTLSLPLALVRSLLRLNSSNTRAVRVPLSGYGAVRWSRGESQNATSSPPIALRFFNRQCVHTAALIALDTCH